MKCSAAFAVMLLYDNLITGISGVGFGAHFPARSRPCDRLAKATGLPYRRDGQLSIHAPPPVKGLNPHRRPKSVAETFAADFWRRARRLSVRRILKSINNDGPLQLADNVQVAARICRSTCAARPPSIPPACRPALFMREVDDVAKSSPGEMHSDRVVSSASRRPRLRSSLARSSRRRRPQSREREHLPSKVRRHRVWLDGGPGPNAPQGAAGLPDGDYYFQVTDPSGKTLLSTDPVKNRQFNVTAGIISGLSGAGNHNLGVDIDHGAATV
jgi:hypothetical protein